MRFSCIVEVGVMAKYSEQYVSDYEAAFGRKPHSSSWKGWLAFLIAVGGAVAFGKYVYLPLRASKAQLQRDAQQSAEQLKSLSAKLRGAEARTAELQSRQDQMAGELAKTVAEREQVETELKRLQSDLASKLEPEIHAGNVSIKRRGNQLVVDLAEQILFDSGQAELNEGGDRVLGQLGQSLLALRGYTIQVGGHTDNARVTNPQTQQKFATNWELSAARATNVVRYLEEHDKIPGERLAAAGFSQYRPSASNNTTEGRKKNRRIELVLLQNDTSAP
jgi:chemotaxis protein MotB